MPPEEKAFYRLLGALASEGIFAGNAAHARLIAQFERAIAEAKAEAGGKVGR